jgi:hypothetical protein
VLYYSSAGFFLLQLEQACSVLPPSVADELGTGIDEPMVGRSAPRPAEVGILIGRLRSLVVKNMTIGIEAPLTTTPENGHRLAS